MKFNVKSEAEKQVRSMFSGILATICSKVYADTKSEEDEKEGDGGGDDNKEDTNKQSTQVNFEDLIAKARKDEKDKLYPQITDLKEKNKELVEKNNNLMLKVGQLEEDIKGLNEQLSKVGKDDPQELIDVKNKLKDALDECSKLQEKVEGMKEVDEAALRATIEAEIKTLYEVKLYRVEKLQEFGDDILVPELVFGDTKEEVDAALERAKAKSDEIRAKLGGSKHTGTRPTAKHGVKPSNPPEKGAKGKELDFDYVSSLDPESKEYREWREKVGMK